MNSALRLDTEKTLAAFIPYLQGLADAAGTWNFLDNIFPAETADKPFYFAAHDRKKVPPGTRGTYIGFNAGTPDWEDGVIFASLNLEFELATGGIDDHDRAPDLTVAHEARVAAIIQMFSQQMYEATKAALNASVAGLQFNGWESTGKAEDGTAPAESEKPTQLVTRLTYVFDVFLTA